MEMGMRTVRRFSMLAFLAAAIVSGGQDPKAVSPCGTVIFACPQWEGEGQFGWDYSFECWPSVTCFDVGYCLHEEWCANGLSSWTCGEESQNLGGPYGFWTCA
jgi:hypothetical protein